MTSELKLIARQISLAKKPEDVFGRLARQGTDLLPGLKKSYHSLVKIAHPDLYQSKDEQILAQSILGQLIEWFRLAEQKIKAGRYGALDDQQKQINIQTKKRSYLVDDCCVQDGIYNLYPCSFEADGQTYRALLQLVRDPHDNELAQNEIAVLEQLQKAPEAAKFSAYFPALIEAFMYTDGASAHQAEIVEQNAGWYSLEEVRRFYPAGIQAKDMAWIWRRLLTALGHAHRNKIIHTAVLPCNVWIQPEQHGLMLRNWVYALSDQASAWEPTLIDSLSYQGWYPADVLNQPALPGLDITLSTKCMLHLLGADPESKSLPEALPTPLKSFFRGCLLPRNRAPQDAWALMQEFDELIEKLWGQRKFHPFKMK